ncbi:unnamed protein product [Clavelina lepadiformis]|uniref:Uncharacterized protein n=1 Tax=Clavelina lepadiformis TaxID=159417 RepID=A0ABP0GTJ1_CLALP
MTGTTNNVDVSSHNVHQRRHKGWEYVAKSGRVSQLTSDLLTAILQISHNAGLNLSGTGALSRGSLRQGVAKVEFFGKVWYPP